MSFSIGIIGLPNVGKSTLFKALTKKQVNIADYPFTTIKPNIGIVAVPDEKLKKIAQVIKPEKITPTVIEFVDIAGLIKNAHKGEGLGNQFLSQIRNCDALVEVVNAFSGNVDIKQDIEIIKTELELKDLESKEKENLLGKKPIIYIINANNKVLPSALPQNIEYLKINLKQEVGLPELSNSLDQLIIACYNILSLITFYTIRGGKETRAWTLKKEMNVYDAAGKVHNDFQEKFIKAEVVNWQTLINAGGWKQARELGQILTAGKEYLVQNGDVIEFKI